MAPKTKAAGDGSGLVEMAWDPITRIVGSLGIHTKIDFKQKRVAECYSTSSVFRGYSVFMRGKDPRDAHFITSRICGICGDNHATCSVYAQNMAYGVKPPHLGEWIINLGESAEYMFDHNIFQENLVGVDYCEKMVKETNPGVLELAERTEAPHAADAGVVLRGDIEHRAGGDGGIDGVAALAQELSTPACAASGSLVATMPCRARTSERPCESHPCARDPGTASIVPDGCGLSGVGMPNGFGDCASPVAAYTTTAAAASFHALCWVLMSCLPNANRPSGIMV